MRNRTCNILYCLLWCLNIALIAVILFCAVSLIIVQLEAWHDYHLRIDIAGISNMLDFWRNFKPFFVVLGYSCTLLVVSSNLIRYTDVETVKLLGDLRSRFQKKELKDIHSYLLQDDEKETILKAKDESGDSDIPNVDIFDYLGTLELGAIMLKRGVITEKEFNSQFGYRVVNVRKNKALMNHIIGYHEYYEYLLWLMDKCPGALGRQKRCWRRKCTRIVADSD